MEITDPFDRITARLSVLRDPIEQKRREFARPRGVVERYDGVGDYDVISSWVAAHRRGELLTDDQVWMADHRLPVLLEWLGVEDPAELGE